MIKTFNLRVPLEFNRLADARVSLESAIASLSVVYWNLERNHCDEDVRAAEELKSEYSGWFQAWDHKFSIFLSRERLNLDGDTLDGCRLLKAHQLAASILASVTYGNGEGVWSSFVPQFRAIVELIAEILKNLPKKGPASHV